MSFADVIVVDALLNIISNGSFDNWTLLEYLNSIMLTSWHADDFCITGPSFGESTSGFPSQRANDVEPVFVGVVSLNKVLNKVLNKHLSCYWFPTLRHIWHHYYDIDMILEKVVVCIVIVNMISALLALCKGINQCFKMDFYDIHTCGHPAYMRDTFCPLLIYIYIYWENLYITPMI